MRRSRNLLFLMLLSLIMCMACEKPIEDEQEKDNKELYIDDDGDIIDDDGDGGDKKDPDNSDGDGKSDDEGDASDSDDDDYTEDPSKTEDRETPYTETGIVDGNNDTGNGGNTGGGNTGGGNSGGNDGVDGNTGDNSGGNTGDGGSSDTTYSTGDTISVIQFINATSAKYLYVKGYIVGCATRNATKSENVDLDAPFKYATALLLADSPNERSVSNMMSVELKSGSKIRETLNLVEHDDMYQRKILIGGYRETYIYIPGIKGSNDFKIYK